MPDLPSGTVTFLFTDVEGSTRLLGELGAEGYAAALAEHRRVVRTAFLVQGGVEVDTQGDAFFAAFPTAPGALAAAAAMTEALATGPIRVRIGIHTGTPLLTEEGYVGDDVHLGARVAASGHGGQVIVSSATYEALEDRAPLLDLGEHRLKDIESAVSIFQLGNAVFPPLKTISNTNLPRPAGLFVGRDDELTGVLARVERGSRLVTLTGPGGTGKTRLAIEAAATLVPAYKAGVFWVGLATLRDPALVTETIARTLGAGDGLAEHIGEREMLLLLDNFEQVIDAATELSSVLTSCPNLSLLVTSRELLRIRGEVEYAVPPLAKPEAVTLFCELAQLEPSEDVAELCVRLDSLPLAVELAAARASVLSPRQMLERLAGRLDLLKGGRDADPRQQTLRATIAWSHDLLTHDEQQLFARLAVFRGGCTLDAAEHITDSDLDILQSLVHKSLLRHTEERFWMLETIREYALEQLIASGQADDLHRRHANHFLALAEEAEPYLQSSPESWIGRLEDEHDNLRAALDRLESSGNTNDAMRLAGALREFWEGSHLKEGLQRLENLVESDDRPTAARAKALAAAAQLARQSGDVVMTERSAAGALSIYRKLGDAQGIADSTVTLGLALADRGDFLDAQQVFENGILLYRAAGDESGVLFATRLLGWMCEELGDGARARRLHEDNLGRARALADRQMEGQTLTALASLALEDGRAADAISMYEDALRIDRERGSNLQTSFDLSRFARALASLGDAPARAALLLAAGGAIREEIGAGTPPFLATIIDEALAGIHAQLDDATFAAAWEEGKALSADEAVALALGEVERDA